MGILFALIIPFLSLSPFTNCEEWKGVEVAQQPTWVKERSEQDTLHYRTFERGGYRYTVIPIDSTRVLLRKQSLDPEVVRDTSQNEPDSLYHESLLLVRLADTLLLDSNRLGFGMVAVSPDSQYAAAQRWWVFEEEVARGDIVLYNLTTGEKTTVFAPAGDTYIRFSSDGGMIAFADYADLYICEVEYPAAERVLHEGGSYWLGGCTDWRTTTEALEWFPNDQGLYFEFSLGEEVKHFRRFEIH